MRILVIEDKEQKFEILEAKLIEKGVSAEGIIRVTTLAELFRVDRRSFDLCIVDLWMPMVGNGEAQDVAAEVLGFLDDAGGFRVPVLVITSFPAEAGKHARTFAEKGCLIYNFYEAELWAMALDVHLSQARDRHRYDFLIFTALDAERKAYLKHADVKIRSVTRSGVDFWDFSWGGLRGAIVVLPRMGLVNASIVTARVLENYSPRLVCMSGICGGIGNDTGLGQLLITELCWEYQSGKWSDEYFSAEPYQIEIEDELRLFFAKKLECPDLIKTLEHDFDGEFRPSKRLPPKLAIFATGSAVIASERRIESVKEQHRKVAGIDMEIYGFHRAVKMSTQKPIVFSAKTVVDKADVNKDDNIHEYGNFISSRFCLIMIESLFAELKIR